MQNIGMSHIPGAGGDLPLLLLQHFKNKIYEQYPVLPWLRRTFFVSDVCKKYSTILFLVYMVWVATWL